MRLPFRVFYAEGLTLPLGDHVFPAEKYRLVAQRLLQDGRADPDDFQAPTPISDEDAARVHDADYLRKLREDDLSIQERLELEVSLSPALVDAFWLASGGTLLAGRRALQDGCAVLLGGGFHHAFADHGEGFCLINDVAIAIAALRAEGRARRVAVIDLDVHQGNGTAALLGRDPEAFTVSLHQQCNYPAHKPPSHVDVGLPDGTADATYLAALERPLRRALDFTPELVFYLAGADPYEQDRLGGLALSLEGLRERDRRVLGACRDGGVPVAVTLAGGYAHDTRDTVTIHAGTVEVAAAVFAPLAAAGFRDKAERSPRGTSSS